MKTVIWEDTTSYRQKEPHPRNPRVWTATINNNLDIIVHRYGDCDGWFLTSHELKMNGYELHKNLDEAKKKALEIVKNRLVADVATKQAQLVEISKGIHELSQPKPQCLGISTCGGCDKACPAY